MMSQVNIGIIGGSGIYDMDGFERREEIRLSTPFGDPSDVYMPGLLSGIPVVFLPRHGRGHVLLPSEVNYRANIFGFKKLGVTHLIAVTAVGSLQEHIEPLHLVVPDQLLDRTSRRIDTFFGQGIAAHIPFAEPFCPDLSDLVFRSASGTAGPVHRGGTLVNIEGPAFSTRAESKLYQKWGADIIGMTTIQEAKLAREAGICFAALALVTDYDAWRDETEAVSVETVVSSLKKNITRANAALHKLAPRIAGPRKCPCAQSLKGSIMTHADAMDGETREKLRPLIEGWKEVTT